MEEWLGMLHLFIQLLIYDLNSFAYFRRKSDMKMLDEYLDLWGSRFKQRTVPQSIYKRLDLSLSGESSPLWILLPEMIHHKATDDSVVVTALLHEKLHALSFYDVVIAGVDFHCSNVVEVMMNDEKICSEVASYNQCHHLHDGHSSKEVIASVIRRCMWHCSSAINSKRPLAEDVNLNESDTDVNRALWTDIFKEAHRSYAVSYITSRLVLR